MAATGIRVHHQSQLFGSAIAIEIRPANQVAQGAPIGAIGMLTSRPGLFPLRAVAIGMGRHNRRGGSIEQAGAQGGFQPGVRASGAGPGLGGRAHQQWSEGAQGH